MQTQTISSSSASGYTPEQIRKVAQDFESLFSSMMLRAMRKTVGENPLLPMSMGEKIYTEMLDDEYAKILSAKSFLGLSGLIVKELEGQESGQNSINQLKNIGTRDFSTVDSRFVPLGKTITIQKSNGYSDMRRWDHLISEAAEKFDIDKNLVSAVIAQESGGNPYAISNAGAKGLMQLMDSTAAELGVAHPYSPWENIQGGAKYLRQMLDQFGGDEKLALASYNAGPAAVKKYNGIPPYPETINYVDSVLRIREQFSKRD